MKRGLHEYNFVLKRISFLTVVLPEGNLKNGLS